MIFVKEFTSFCLSLRFEVTTFHFGEVTSVSEYLDERLLIKSLISSLFKFTNSVNSPFNEFLLTDICWNSLELRLLFLASLFLDHLFVLNGDCLL